MAVSDEELVEGMKLLARTEGVFAETAGGVVVAGLRRLVQAGLIQRRELTVAYITGNGLKTLEAVAGNLVRPLTVEPNVASFEAAFKERAGGG